MPQPNLTTTSRFSSFRTPRGQLDGVTKVVIDRAFAAVRPGDRLEGARISLNLSAGQTFIGIVERLETARYSDCVWLGRIEGELDGRFMLVVNRGAVVGEIVTSSGRFQLACAGDGLHTIRRMPATHAFDCQAGTLADFIPSHPEPPVLARPSRPYQPIDGCPILIDAMVVYTASSRRVLGGEAATLATIDAYMVYTNSAYQRSGVDQRVRLVHAREIDYVESGNSLIDLQRLQLRGDGFMDEIHPLRDQWGADVVSLINTSGSAGVGFLMTRLDPGFADFAFSAIAADTGPLPIGLVFAHETGHNMGCGHNNEPGARALFCYSFGYRTPDVQWRTIMSGSPGQFIDYFSNPRVEFMGWPLGVPGEGCPPDAADNARSLNEAAETVAAFRPTRVEDPCVPSDLGDLNCDGQINAFDIEPFLVALFDPKEYAVRYPECDINLADINGDGSIDAFDIEPFLDLLFP
ncbi:MAG: hypothetical protein IID33_09750 [Planctomycetes bacterium]|nr:hypothetical protein [Planctomycetota bacterium]